jgi:hypothetical protein
LSGSASASVLPYFSSFQKAFGFYFITSGNRNCICDLYFLHRFLYDLNASLVRWFFFPYARLVYLYIYLAYRQVSSNHGAKCLAQRLGLRWIFYVCTFITPAFTPSFIINASSFSVRSSLSSLNSVVISFSFVANLSSLVYALHVYMLFMYSRVSSRPIHS